MAPEELFAYATRVLATPAYVRRFWEELTLPGPRIPLTRDPALFARAAELGRRLLWLHTYGQRFVPVGVRAGKVPPGKARCKAGTARGAGGVPRAFRLRHVVAGAPRGQGRVRPVCGPRCGSSASRGSRSCSRGSGTG